MHWSEFASKIPCLKCGTNNSVTKWPKNGDFIGWYCEYKPGNHNIEVTCSKCNNKFYVNWDDFPGPILDLF
jgi:hypothetical protein